MSNLQVEMETAKSSVEQARARLFENIDRLEDVYLEERALVKEAIDSVSQNIHAVTHPLKTLSRHTGALLLVASTCGYFIGRKLFCSALASEPFPDKASALKTDMPSAKLPGVKSPFKAAISSLLADLAIQSIRSVVSKKIVPEHRTFFENTFDKHFKANRSNLNNESNQSSSKPESASP